MLAITLRRPQLGLATIRARTNSQLAVERRNHVQTPHFTATVQCQKSKQSNVHDNNETGGHHFHLTKFLIYNVNLAGHLAFNIRIRASLSNQ